jgi:hypothetical protein
VLDDRLRFDHYVVGAANRLAASAARAVAEAPGHTYNPLFVHSGPGLGKTHLLHAIVHRVGELHPDLRCVYTTLDDFVDQLHTAIGSGQADGVKRQFADAGVLLLDDVQSLSGRPETQSEVLRTFNHLQGAGRQIVLAADRAPADIRDVDQRLLNRFAGGLIVEIGALDHELRLGILRQAASERGVTFLDGVLEELARAAGNNARELQGAINQLAAWQALEGRPVPAGEIWHVLGAARLPAGPNEFELFLEDVTRSVASTVDAWRTHLSERVAFWSGQGFRTHILEQALESREAQDVADLDASFGAIVDRLRDLERTSIRLDPGLTGHPAFRDPERLQEAERLAIDVRERIDRVGRFTPVPEGAEAAAPNIDLPADPSAHPPRRTPALPVAAIDHGPPDALGFDSEKVVVTWPDVTGRVLEEWR